MQMLNKYFLLFLFFLLSARLFSKQEPWSLMTMIEPYKNSYIKTDDINEIIRAFDLNTGTTATTFVSTFITGSNHNASLISNGMDWHPTNNWLAVVGRPFIAGMIFNFSMGGTALYQQNILNDIKWTNTLRTPSWHPSGNFLAFTGAARNGAGESPIVGQVLAFDQSTGLISTISTSCDIWHSTDSYGNAWHPSGNYLTIGGIGPGNIDHLKTYSFDSYALWELPYAKITYSPNPTGFIRTIAWHPSGNYVAFGGTSAASTAIDTQVAYFNEKGQSFTVLPGCNAVHGAEVRRMNWSPNGQYLATTGVQISGINTRIYRFDGASLTLTASIYHGTPAGGVACFDVNWASDGSFILTGGTDGIVRFYSFFNQVLSEMQQLRYTYGTASSQVLGLSVANNNQFYSVNGAMLSGATTVQVVKLTEPTDFVLKKQKKELIKIKNMFASTSATLPQLYETTLSTSALIDSTISFSISSLTTVTSFLVNGIITASQPSFDWHPSNDLIAISSANNNYIYFYTGSALTLVDSTVTTEPIATTDTTWDIKFSPRGNFLISGGWRDYIHSFDNVNLTQLSSKYDHLFNGIEWDKSGNFVFCCEQRTTPTTTTNDPGRLSAYYFDGTSLTKMTSTGDLEYSTQMSVNYNNHLVAKGGNKGKVNIYAFDALTTNTLSFVQSLNELTTSVSTVLFHPTQDILFVNTDTKIRAFSINGTFTTELTGCQVSAAGALFLDFDPTGKYLLVSFADKFIVFKFDGTTLSEVIRYSSGSDILSGAKWSYNGKNIATLVDTGSTIFLRILRVNFNSLNDSSPNLLQETSNALVALATLARANSNAIVTLNTLNINTSNSLLSDALTIANSNALSGLLVRTSQAVNSLLIQDSQAILSFNELAVANSNTIVTQSILSQANSNSLVTYQPLIVNTSNAINGLLVVTSNAISGLLVATSNAVAGLLVATSNATAGLLVATSNATNALALKALALNTIDTGPSHLHFNATSITMSYNILLSTDHQLFVHTSGVINGNGHSITFAKGNGTFFTIDPAITTTFQNVIFKDYNDPSVLIGAGASLIFGQGCRVELNEPQTLSRTWSFAGQSLLDAHNNNISLGTGTNYLSSLISSSLTIANANLINVRDNNIRTANNNTALIFNNAQLYLSSDFTYSIGSIVINNDVILSGTSIFNYSTIMGLTIASQSKLTVDQGCTFNYAPAGNFRNLLSFTDSSATLFFNNASLVATSTGPRLINGTLLVDGIMNIQSSGASTAEAIIFGNGTPANDLIIKLMPSATINLLSGFLNYANAQ